MVSGFVTSPDDQSRICLDDASPMRIASKSLMSIKALLRPSLFLYLYVGQRARLGLGLLLRFLFGCHLHVGEVAQRLVRREGQLLPGLVDALLAFLNLLGGRLPRGGAERARREVDAELLGCPQQLVVLLA